MKYVFSQDDFEAIKTVASEASLNFFNLSDDLKNYEIDSKKFQSLQAGGSFNSTILAKVIGFANSDDMLSAKSVYPFKLYDLVSERIPDSSKYNAPFGIDFKTDLNISLAKKTLPKSQGKPTSVEYYEKKELDLDAQGAPVLDASGNFVFNYINLICKIDFALFYNAIGFITKKDVLIKWFRQDGTISTEYKNIGEIYDPILDYEKQIEEGIKRRTSIINGLQLPVLGMLSKIYPTKQLTEVLLIGRTFMEQFDAIFLDFKSKSSTVSDSTSTYFGKKVAYAEIMKHSKVVDNAWLDSIVDGITPRNFIANELDI